MPLERVSSILIAGLGNPGIEYEKTRHNIGFMVADSLNQQSGSTFEHVHLHYCMSRLKWHENQLCLIKPLTYMNLSGLAVHNAILTYRIPIDRVLIVYDDINLPIGRIRIRKNGSDGGQKGLKSILQTLGTKEIARLRIGIGNPEKGGVIDYVLSPFSDQEVLIVKKCIKVACQAICDFADNGLDHAMNFYNGLNCE